MREYRETHTKTKNKNKNKQKLRYHQQWCFHKETNQYSESN